MPMTPSEDYESRPLFYCVYSRRLFTSVKRIYRRRHSERHWFIIFPLLFLHFSYPDRMTVSDAQKLLAWVCYKFVEVNPLPD